MHREEGAEHASLMGAQCASLKDMEHALEKDARLHVRFVRTLHPRAWRGAQITCEVEGVCGVMRFMHAPIGLCRIVRFTRVLEGVRRMAHSESTLAGMRMLLQARVEPCVLRA